MDRKVSIFDQSFNPQAATCLTKVYSMILVATKSQPATSQRIVLGLAFNESLLLKMLKFIEVYGGGHQALLTRDDTIADEDYLDQYHSFVHCLVLINVALKHNLWLSSFEDFIKGQYLMKSDLVTLIETLKPVIMSLLEMVNQGKKLTPLDDYVL